MNSRYDSGVTAWVDTPDRGRVQAVYLSTVIWYNYPYTDYQATDSDRLDLLAYQTYGDATKWWMIAEMNPRITSPDDIMRGDILHIPANVV